MTDGFGVGVFEKVPPGQQHVGGHCEQLALACPDQRGIVADLSIVHAWKGDTEGNLVYRKTARNFNPMMATSGKMTVAEVENLVKPGEIDPDHIITPGVYVKRIVHVPNAVKHIEQRTVRKRA